MEIQKKQINEQQAFAKLAAMCARAEHSSGEMREKMKRWQLEDAIQERIIEKLKKEKFINDERFCRLFAHDKARFDKWGRRKIEQALYKKGITPDIYTTILDETDRNIYVETLKPMIEAKRRTTKAANDYEMKAKLIRYAMGRGFTMDIINECMDADDDYGLTYDDD